MQSSKVQPCPTAFAFCSSQATDKNVQPGQPVVRCRAGQGWGCPRTVSTGGIAQPKLPRPGIRWKTAIQKDAKGSALALPRHAPSKAAFQTNHFGVFFLETNSAFVAKGTKTFCYCNPCTLSELKSSWSGDKPVSWSDFFRREPFNFLRGHQKMDVLF